MTAIDEMKADLDSKLGQRTDLVEAMEAQSQRVVGALTLEVKARWEEDVARERANHASYVKTIPGDDLRAVKEELNELLQQADVVIPSHFEDDSLWSHRQELSHDREEDRWHMQGSSPYRPYRSIARGNENPRYPDVLDEPIRTARGEIGSILRQLVPDGDEMTRSGWGRSGWKRFPFGMHDPGDGVVDELQAYAELDQQLQTADREIRQIIRQIDEAEAQMKWDEV
jgi:hypothetical protein